MDDHKKITGKIPKKVINFPGVTNLDIPPERVLQAAIEADLDEVIISGWTKDGELWTSSSTADGGNCLWLWEQLKLTLLQL